jgi:fused signal recognition particle receptor
MGFFDKLTQGLKKTKAGFLDQIEVAVSAFTIIDDDLFDELEEILIMSDLGAYCASDIIDLLKKRLAQVGGNKPDAIKEQLKFVMTEMLGEDTPLILNTKPSVILVIGVNGVGKTTSIAKIAHRLKSEGKKVILGAADTFRAAAADQLTVWANRTGVDIIRHNEGADPAAVVFDTISAAKARDYDVIICDTAGRLHNKKNLMNELSKIDRVISRELPDASRETLLVLDSTTGQNAVNQAKEFKNAAPITGIILTKLDGTAKGGIVIPIVHELSIPVKFIGVGEQMDDLQPFAAAEFVNALFE